MKYLFVSDIHGCLPTLRKALDFYRSQRADMLCLLGDILNYGPRNSVPEGLDAKGVVEELNKLADKIVAVRGNCDAEVDQMLLHFPLMQDYMLLVDNGVKLLLTHGHVYNKEHLPSGQVDAVLYGHTHLWELEKAGDMVVCNTGSITFPKQGNPPTMVVYENRKFLVYTLDGELLKELSF